MKQWKVTMNGGFRPGRGKAGEEIVLNKQFTWGDEIWHVPAVYVCNGGLVVDFCIQVDMERMKAYYKKVKSFEENQQELTEDEELLLRSENPLGIDFNPEINLNGEVLSRKIGYGQAWISFDITGENSWEDQEAKWILEHYQLDISKAWVIQRFTFPWKGIRRRKIEKLELYLEREKVGISGLSFQTPAVGENIKFTHPITGLEHTLTVRKFEKQRMNESIFQDDSLEFPRHFAVMTYTIYPELARNEFMLKDRCTGDNPRPKNVKGHEIHGTIVSAVTVIGHADPTIEVYHVNGVEMKTHHICSNLHFEPIQEPIEWQMIFQKKTMDDITIELL